ncbi:MAG: 1-acyl-sn-glycerol-3-phosphate acyltransferase [Alphaproteobacteria bacterium]|nr:1-acyl-sn-glycerol-3-phosphate acyltransferase [Alphaproteobacteria bacterium]
MIVLRSLIFNLLFFSATALVVLLGWPALLVGRPAVMWVRRNWINLMLATTRWVAGIQLEIRGAEHLPSEPVIFAAKHQSAWEALFLNELLNEPAIVLKRELTRIPIFGAFINGSGMVPIDRSDGLAALKLIVRAARPVIDGGRSILIFPQGTRVAPGDHKPYQPGVFALYRTLRVPVVPIALNSGMFWPRNAFWKRPGTVVVEVLPPIPPGLDRDAFIARLEEVIETATTRLEAEAARQLGVSPP